MKGKTDIKVDRIVIKVSLTFINQVTELPPSVRADLDQLVLTSINYLNKNSKIKRINKGFCIQDTGSCKNIPIVIEFYDAEPKVMRLCRRVVRKLTKDKTILRCFCNNIYSLKQISMVT